MSTELIERADAPIAPATIEDHEGVTMFERLAKDATVPVEKLERLIELQRAIRRDNAKAEFDAAFSQMQGEIPLITERGEILVNGQLRSKYARLEDILEVCRPILMKHGFAIRHRNTMSAGLLTVTGILSHRSGHSEEDQFEAKADTSGSKNDIQALGSTRTYGQRYTTISLIGIATSGEDDNGRKSQKPATSEPTGYREWIEKMTVAAGRGLTILEAGFREGQKEHRDYLAKNDAITYAKLKTQARGVK